MRMRYLDWSHAPHGDEPVYPKMHTMRLSAEDLAQPSSPSEGTDPLQASHPDAPADESSQPVDDDSSHSRTDRPPHPLARELHEGGGAESSPTVADDVDLPQDVRTHIQSSVPPLLEEDERFDVVIGSDLLYEVCVFF